MRRDPGGTSAGLMAKKTCKGSEDSLIRSRKYKKEENW